MVSTNDVASIQNKAVEDYKNAAHFFGDASHLNLNIPVPSLPKLRKVGSGIVSEIPLEVDVFDSLIPGGEKKMRMSVDEKEKLAEMLNKEQNITEFEHLKDPKASGKRPSFIPNYAQADVEFAKPDFFQLKLDTVDVKKLFASVSQLAQEGRPIKAEAPGVSLTDSVVETGLVSNVVELNVEQVIDPEKNKRRTLNANPIFDVTSVERPWSNWQSKTFTPTPATGSPSHFQIKRLQTAFINHADYFESFRRDLESKNEVYSDNSFKPIMATLRGFGGDASWE